MKVFELDMVLDRPAVFVQFGAIVWEPVVGCHDQRGSCLVRLHIVTDWDGGDGTSVFDFSEKIQETLYDLRGEHFHGFQLVETHTNHNHEEIVESIEIYKLRCVRSL